MKNGDQIASTRKKLAVLENTYERTSNNAEVTERVRVTSLRSLKRLINQLKEEIARYEARGSVR